VTRAGYFIDGLNVVMARYRKHATNSYKTIAS
jgi:alpha-1,3-rhamnosyltransferase